VKIYFVCQHKPIEIDEKKVTPTTACAECGETRRAGVTVRPPTFSAQGIAARGPLVKRVDA
jgi:hypothetical protein